MNGNYLLSPERRLTEEKLIIWKKPVSHVESNAELRICNAIKANWNRGEMKITNILLEGGTQEAERHSLRKHFRLNWDCLIQKLPVLNEALRDRIQHAEKMDLPPIGAMVERAACKTGCENQELLQIIANVIILLDKTAKANAIKGVAGMRSYFYWVDAVMHETDGKCRNRRGRDTCLP